ncbi:hypothetical protein JYQ62_24905 [Nostoc sp. UHCC 0702]|nr:hypothetical protein JYQ62_24905 [Nostoc sp. UHCC 0702]
MGHGAYFRFVQKQVQEHTNDSVPLSRGDYLRFFTQFIKKKYLCWRSLQLF